MYALYRYYVQAYWYLRKSYKRTCTESYEVTTLLWGFDSLVYRKRKKKKKKKKKGGLWI
jgi:hypothetical protein